MARPLTACLFAPIIAASAIAAALPAVAQQANSAADAARNLAAAVAKGDTSAATSYIAASDRERFTTLMAASNRLAQARASFQDSTAKLSIRETAMRAVSQPAAPAKVIDHIVIVSQREVNADAVELQVRGYGTDGRSSKDPSTWQAVRENGNWRIHLPPCVSPAAMEPTLKRYRDLTAATERLTASVRKGDVSELADARIALFKAEQDVLRGEGAAQ